MIYYLPDDQRMAHLIVPENTTQVTLAPRAIINPGSVGQPRDRDPRAAYALLDMDDYTWEWHRVAYDIPSVQERMRQARAARAAYRAPGGRLVSRAGNSPAHHGVFRVITTLEEKLMNKKLIFLITILALVLAACSSAKVKSPRWRCRWRARSLRRIRASRG